MVQLIWRGVRDRGQDIEGLKRVDSGIGTLKGVTIRYVLGTNSLCSNTSIRLAEIWSVAMDCTAKFYSVLFFSHRELARFTCLNRIHSFNKKEKRPLGQSRCTRSEVSCPQRYR